jgi:hypothetical protein
MGNHSSNLFCPGKDQPVAEPLLDPPGLGVCAPTVPSGMPQLVFDVASQHGSSTNIDPSVRPATLTTEPFAPVSSLPERHWQTALQATVRPSTKDPTTARPATQDPTLPFVSSRFHERKTNDNPVLAGGVNQNRRRGFNIVTKHSGLCSAKSGKRDPRPNKSPLPCKWHFPPTTKATDCHPRRSKNAKTEVLKKKREPKECSILSEKDITIFTKKLQNLATHLELASESPHCSSPTSGTRTLDGEVRNIEMNNRLLAIQEVHLALKYHTTLRTKNFNRQRAHARSVKTVLNVRANEKWRSENKFQASHCAMVSTTHSNPFSTPTDDYTERRAPRASSFEEETQTEAPIPSFVTPGTRASSPALAAFNNLGTRFQHYLRPTASLPTPRTPSDVLNTTADAECNTTMEMSSPEYIATRTTEFVEQFQSMNRNDLIHMAQVLKLYEKSGFDPSEVFDGLPSASASSMLAPDPHKPSVPTLVPTPSTPSAPTTTTTRPQPPQPPDDDPSSSDSSSSSSSSDDSIVAIHFDERRKAKRRASVLPPRPNATLKPSPSYTVSLAAPLTDLKSRP